MLHCLSVTLLYYVTGETKAHAQGITAMAGASVGCSELAFGALNWKEGT